MLETGAIARLVALIKTVAPKDQVVQIMIVNVGAGTLLAALGATPVSILPPIMLALGYSSFVAIALPALGYDALCTYALLGIPVVVFSNFVGLPVNQVGGYFARFMPVISTCIALGMLWIVGRWALVRRGLLPALIAGLTAGFIAIAMNAAGMVTLTGVAAGLGVVLVMLAYLKLTKRPLIDRGVLNEADHAAEAHISLWAAVSPWLLLVVFAILVNAPILPFFNLTFNQWAMPVAVIPTAPEKVRLFWQAYFWVLVSTLLALPFLKPSRAQISNSLRKWLKRAPRPMLASAVFFAIAFIINHSGKGLDWQLTDPTHNMVYVVASASAAAFGRFYPLVAPFLGLLGGFVSGSESLGDRHADRAASIDRREDRRDRAAGGGRQRHRRRAGQRHLAGQAAERFRQHRPDRRRGAGVSGHLRDLDGHYRSMRGNGIDLGILKIMTASSRKLSVKSILWLAAGLLILPACVWLSGTHTTRTRSQPVRSFPRIRHRQPACRRLYRYRQPCRRPLYSLPRRPWRRP